MPSYTPACARRRKLRTWSGALSGVNDSVMSPIDVSSTARYRASSSIESVENGSGVVGRLVANRDLVDDDAIHGETVVVDGSLGDLLCHEDAFDDTREDRVLAIERRLIRSQR